MRKRTPQEIADFFGCYIAQDRDGSWYLYDEKPIEWSVYGTWSTEKAAIKINELVITPECHDWTRLYE